MRNAIGSRRMVCALVVSMSLAVSSARAAELHFLRGDTNGDGSVDISDGIATLGYLFLGGIDVGCFDAADADDNGEVELTDGVFTFGFLFSGGLPLPSPGHLNCGADPTADSLTCDRSDLCDQPPSDTPLSEAGHVLNRLAYGPTPDELARVETIGARAYIEEQLDPASIDESANDALNARVENLFEERYPSADTRILTRHETWRYFKGITAPPTEWREPEFDDSGWLQGETSIGYGDNDDETYLDDMRRESDDPETPDVDESQPGYASVFLRKTIHVSDPSTIDQLFLNARYDDGFAAYLNGSLLVRVNVPTNATYNTLASDGHESDDQDQFNVTNRLDLLVPGANVLAVQVHNVAYTSSDLTFEPELVSSTRISDTPTLAIEGIDALQELIHIRGIYSRRQLQAVLGEFWENHFTTDYDKLVEYFDDLEDANGDDAMSENQAEQEAAQVEYEEYEFYYENALGYFGDLLRYSAASPSMVVYLDNVLNVRGSANENYSREILELSAFGVDNRYTQEDIQELAKAFTGWQLCKVAPDDKSTFPLSTEQPLTACPEAYLEEEIVSLGPGWVYRRGTSEPTPAEDGAPTTDWTLDSFDDSSWTAGSTGIGYGDGDDATVLSDMRNRYTSVYLRREFTVDDPLDVSQLTLSAHYDDGFVAYINGVEVARSGSMEDAGYPPAYDELSDNHEASSPSSYNLSGAVELLRPAPEVNVLAIQVHNTNLTSSDLSMRPRLLNRTRIPGVVDVGDRGASWVFRFNPSEHDISAKELFPDSPYEIQLPSGRTGVEGVRDALDVVDSMISHPSTSEFICIKLIQRFVSDEISLPSFKDGSAPIELRELLADMIAAWNSTSPPGHIGTVLEALFDPVDQESAFWSDMAYRAKVKSPVEYINSSLRVFEANADTDELAEVSDELGMLLFVRDDPDGFAEAPEYFGTASLLVATEFVRSIPGTGGPASVNMLSFADRHEIATAEEVVDFVERVFFQGALSSSNKAILLDFLTTDSNGNPRALNRGSSTDFRRRLEEFFGFVLSMPEWHFQ